MSIARRSRGPAASNRRRRSSMPSANFVRVDHGRARGLGEYRRRGEGTPAVAVLRHPLPGSPVLPPIQIGGCGVLTGRDER